MAKPGNCSPALTSTLAASFGSVTSASARPLYSIISSSGEGLLGMRYAQVSFWIGSANAPPSLAYISFSLRNSVARISVSSLASPGPSAAFQRHWMTRPELVKLPAVSANSVLGRRKTSVWIVAGSTSLNSP